MTLRREDLCLLLESALAFMRTLLLHTDAIAPRDGGATRRELYLRVILHDVMPAPKLRNVNSVEMRESLLSLIPNVRAFAVVLCGDPERADDLVQETLLKAWTHFERFEPGTNLQAWLFTILRNHYFSECRMQLVEVS
jgi:hypothetical protein